MNVKKYKDYFEFNGYKYVLKKDIEQVEIDRLYYCISLNRRIPYVEYLDIMDLIFSGKYRKQIVEDMFNVFYIK